VEPKIGFRSQEADNEADLIASLGGRDFEFFRYWSNCNCEFGSIDSGEESKEADCEIGGIFLLSRPILDLFDQL